MVFIENLYTRGYDASITYHILSFFRVRLKYRLKVVLKIDQLMTFHTISLSSANLILIAIDRKFSTRLAAAAR